jgi:Protein of unknown function (DUF4241)
MKTLEDKTLIGYCGVDSGQIMFVDPCYVKDFTDGEDFEPSAKPYPFSYNGACGATLSSAHAGELSNGMACVVSSGWGDGQYPVYVTYNYEGRIASATIVFISDEPDYEDQDDEDSDNE